VKKSTHILLATAIAAVVHSACAAAAAYNDLAPYDNGRSDDFWNTQSHANVVVDAVSASVDFVVETRETTQAGGALPVDFTSVFKTSFASQPFDLLTTRIGFLLFLR